MITVFSGTNRPESYTRKVAEHAYKLLQDHSQEAVKFFSLEDLPADMLHSQMYEGVEQSAALAAIQDEFLIPAKKLYFVVPEYNGSFPGVLKFFLDACSIREYKASFQGGKKAALLGVASGRAGNLRGMEHLTGVLNYLQITVMPNRLPISSIEKVISPRGEFISEETQKVLDQQIIDFVNF